MAEESSFQDLNLKNSLAVVEAVGMWESRSDFQGGCKTRRVLQPPSFPPPLLPRASFFGSAQQSDRPRVFIGFPSVRVLASAHPERSLKCHIANVCSPSKGLGGKRSEERRVGKE